MAYSKAVSGYDNEVVTLIKSIPRNTCLSSRALLVSRYRYDYTYKDLVHSLTAHF